MVSSKEINNKLKAMDGKLPSKKREISYYMEIPTELNKDVCVFDFDTMPLDTLSKYVNELFEWWGYSLEEGTTYDGVYGRGSADELFGYNMLFNFVGFANIFYKGLRHEFIVKINEEKGRTYLTISKGHIDLYSRYITLGTNVFDNQFHRIIKRIKYPYNPDEGYLVCDNCKSYYELQAGETPDDFTDECECGGKLRYFNNINWLFSKEEDEPVSEDVLEESIKDEK